MAADFVFLKDEKLHTLAELIYNQEVLNIQSIIFQSEDEGVTYLNDSRSNYLTETSLLNSSAELKTKLQNDSVRSPTAVNIHAYTESCINNALQIFQNYTVRKDYLEKINEHVRHLITSLEQLDTQNAAGVAALAMQVEECNRAIVAYAVKYRSPASQEFSRVLKAQNITFENLVQTYQAKLSITGQFKDLDDVQKLEVYDEIMEVSGRGRALQLDTIKNVVDKIGKAVLLFNAGNMVWDIYTADHVLLTAVKEAIVAVAKYGGAELGTIVGAALGTELAGVEASALFIYMAGLLGRIAGAFLVGDAAELLVSSIIGTAEPPPPKSTENLKFYVAPMPDGAALARQIAHQ